MIPASDIARAKAVPIGGLVAAVCEVKRDYALCIWHNERTPSMHIDRKRNIVFCFGCGAHADPIAWVQRTKGLAFADAVRELCCGRVDAKPDRSERKASRGSPDETPSLVLDLWRTATAPEVADFYLRSRGLRFKSLPDALRGHKRVWCKEAGEFRPAMLAAVTGPSGDITAIQRTWVAESLTFDGRTIYEKGARPTDLSAGKKSLGQLGVGAVRLAAAGEVLGIGEGVESSLAAARLFRIPVWSACGRARMGSIELPAAVKCVVLFGDNDEPGRAAVAKAEAEYSRRGYAVQSYFPDGRDWAEMLA